MQDRNSRPTRSKNNYGGKRRSGGDGDRPFRPKRPSSKPAGHSRYAADGERPAYRGEKRRSEGGFERRGERKFDERRSGRYEDRRNSGRGSDRKEGRGGFDRSERRGGFDRSERRGGFDRSERRSGFDRSERRGGFDRSERRGGFGGRDNRRFEKRDDRRFDKRTDRRFDDRRLDREDREERREFRGNRMPALKATPTAYKKREKPAETKPVAKKVKHEKVLMEKAGNMLYPVPAVLVACTDPETGNPNVMTVAWTGTICSDPAMVSISVRPERYSHDMIKMCGNFTINLTTEELAWATDYCGVKSGRDVNKFQEAHLTPEDSEFIDAPTIKESPVSLECEVRDMVELGSHDMFIAEVLAVHVDQAYMDQNGAFHLEDANPMSYIHGKYYATGKELGFFGYSVAKKK